MKKRDTLLMHVCCGPCAGGAVRRVAEDYDVTLFYSNSNIWPEAEYYIRLESARMLAVELKLPLVEDVYDHTRWLKWIKGREKDPEGGRRCELCFRFNIGRTAIYAENHRFDRITTTLTISPHKSVEMVFLAGNSFEKFLPVDFRKKDGFKHSIEISRRYNLYRQHYCGCEFSIRQSPGKITSG
ncbi:MAG: epoxyqueuosine reductase QueH [Verrucomicrobiota bacterium]